MGVTKDKLIDYLLSGSLFQEELLIKYYNCVKKNEEKDILELHNEISNNLNVTSEKGVAYLMMSLIIQTLFTNFSLCYTAYRDNDPHNLKSKTLKDIQITIPKVIKAYDRSKKLVNVELQDCRLFEFMNHMRNAISHCSFELIGQTFQFRDIDFDTHDTSFYAEFSVEELINIYRKWQSFFVTIRLNAV